MNCPGCHSDNTRIVKTVQHGNETYRKHACDCGERWDTRAKIIPGSRHREAPQLRLIPDVDNGYMQPLIARKRLLVAEKRLLVATNSLGGVGGGLSSGIRSGSESVVDPISSVIPSGSLEATDQRELEQTRARSNDGANYSDPFLVFWRAYPRKTGKGAAWQAWKRMRPDLQAVMNAIAWQRTSAAWTKDGGAFIPHPATYLNQRRWEDEPEERQAPVRRGRPYA